MPHWITLKPTKVDPQGAGSAITYGRRYSYAAALSLSLGDDDDGNAASATQTPVQTPKQSQPIQTQPNIKTTITGQDANLISDAQVKYCFKLKNDKKIGDEDYKRMIAEHSEGNVEIKQLNKSQASKFITFLTAYAVPSFDVLSNELPF